MRVERRNAERLIDIPLAVGEGPVWDARTQSLYFVDVLAPALFHYDPATGATRRFDMPSAIGSFGLCPVGRAVVGLKTGVHVFDFHSGALAFLVHPEPDKPQNRLNDGKIGPDGRYWVGSMDDRPEKEPVGALYRVDVAGRSECMVEGIIVSNGLAWSPDGRTMYHSDSRGRYVQAFDFDPATGDLSRQRRICMLEEGDGRPDGGACDAEGFYWSAGVTAGCLNRIAPDGTIVLKIELPLLAPTMPCFGGRDLKTLYVTSLTTERNGERQAGSLIAIDVDVAGAPIARFGEPLALS